MTSTDPSRSIAFVMDGRPWAQVGGAAIRRRMLVQALRLAAQVNPIAVSHPSVPAAQVAVAEQLDQLAPWVTVFSGNTMAQLAVNLGERLRGHFVYDAHNVESTLLRTHNEVANRLGDPAFRRRYPMSRAEAMERVERSAVSLARMVWAVSADDAMAFAELGARHVTLVPNVVDPAAYDNNRSPSIHRVLFVGRLDYLPNVWAVDILCTAAIPRLRARRRDIDVVIAGANPAQRVIDVCRDSGAALVANPSDTTVRRLWRGAILALPLPRGGGSRVKVLQAFASRTPVVASAAGVAGLAANPWRHYWPARNVDDLVSHIESIHRAGPSPEILDAAHDLVQRRYSPAALTSTLRNVLRSLDRPDATS